LRQHGWRSRVESLFSAIGRPVGEAVATPVRIVNRPVVHYQRGRRRIPFQR
jgi:hypothetical protein